MLAATVRKVRRAPEMSQGERTDVRKEAEKDIERNSVKIK